MLFASLTTSASHITGGEIFYKCIGGDEYEITMLLWRDCDSGITANLPTTAYINAYYIERVPLFIYGDALATGFPVGMPRLVYDTLDLSAYGNSCFIPPDNICVMEAVYIDTITLPFISGGYQIAWECGNRNEIIKNIDDAEDIGSSLIMNIPMTTIDYHLPTIVWFEDFEDRSVGDEDDAGSTAWSTECASTSPCGLNDPDTLDYFEVRSNEGNLEYEGRDMDNEAVWTSEAIDISSYASGVRISMELSEDGTLESADYIRAYYKIDGGAETALTNGLHTDNFGSAIATANGLIGSTLEIVVRMKNSSSAEFARVDDILVTEMSIWREDFQDLAVGDESDVGATAWTTTCAAGPAPPNNCGLNDGSSGDYFEVRNDGGDDLVYEGQDMDNEAVWTSEAIDISSYASGVSIRMELSESGYDNGSDYVRAYYKIDGGAETALTNGLQSGDFGSAIATATALIGTTLEIVVRVMNGTGGNVSDEGRFDDIDVYEYSLPDTIGQIITCNSSPEFNSWMEIHWFIHWLHHMKATLSAGGALVMVVPTYL